MGRGENGTPWTPMPAGTAELAGGSTPAWPPFLHAPGLELAGGMGDWGEGDGGNGIFPPPPSPPFAIPGGQADHAGTEGGGDWQAGDGSSLRGSGPRDPPGGGFMPPGGRGPGPASGGESPPRPLGDSLCGAPQLSSRQFQVLLTLFSECFSSFPHGTFSLSVSRPFSALGGVHHPYSGCTIKQPYSKIA